MANLTRDAIENMTDLEYEAATTGATDTEMGWPEGTTAMAAVQHDWSLPDDDRDFDEWCTTAADQAQAVADRLDEMAEVILRAHPSYAWEVADQEIAAAFQGRDDEPSYVWILSLHHDPTHRPIIIEQREGVDDETIKVLIDAIA